MDCDWRTRGSMRRQASIALLAMLFLVSVVAGSLGGISVDATSEPIRIDKDTTLTADLYGCVEIVADNIVLDLNGYSIIGPEVHPLPLGIDLTGRTGVTITNGAVTNFGCGISLEGCEGCTISDATLVSDGGFGVWLQNSERCTIRGVTMPPQWSAFGLFLQQSGECIISDNTIHATCMAGAAIAFEQCWECTISHNTLSGDGINGDNLQRSTISDNTLYAWIGIRGGFEECIIRGNILSANWIGLFIESGFKDNIVVENIVSNTEIGIEWADYWGSTICHNQFYHNNFIDNTILIEALTSQPCGDNTWDNGYPSGGNYWSEYTGLDAYSGPDQDQPGSDGIGDSPFVFNIIHDNYPLRDPFIHRPVETINDLIDEIESWALLQGTEKSLTYQLDAVIIILNNNMDDVAIELLGAFIKYIEAIKSIQLTMKQVDHLLSQAEALIFSLSR